MEGVECIECEACSVCLREFLMSIGFMKEDSSRSSLLSDWTSGLVGALKMKLFEKEDENDGALDRHAETLSSWSTGGNRESS